LARIRNITHGGIGLTCTRRFEVGTFVAIELQLPNQDFPRVVPARVVHARTERGRSGWFFGCEFVNKLSDEDLKSLLS
jgi:hypothetical protein